MSIKILLVEGRDVVRLGIKAMIDDQPGIEIIAEAATENEALKILKTLNPDVILMDLDSPPRVGLNFTVTVKKRFPNVKILILTIQDYESSLISMLEAGADGYVLKNTSPDELVFAINKINKEGSYMKPELILHVLAKYKASASVVDGGRFNISDVEMDVLNLIAEGLTNAQIANKLHTSVRTIETRRKKLLDKTSTSNTATLIRFAVLNGLIA
jgi:two-component system response regulator NreC